MLQALLPLSSAGLAVLGAVNVEGSSYALLLLIVAAFVLLWADARLLLVALSDPGALDQAVGIRSHLDAMRLHPVALVTYPIGSLATCVAVVCGLLLLIAPEPEAAAGMIAGAWIGGGALRLFIGTAAFRLTMSRIPETPRTQVQDALRFG